MRKDTATLGVIAGWLAFVCSLIFPVWLAHEANTQSYYMGYSVLLFGWTGIFSLRILYLAWFANPLMIVATLVFASGQHKGASIVSSIALAIASCSLVMSDGDMKIANSGPGYLLWYVALVAISGSMTAFYFSHNQMLTPENPQKQPK